MNIPLVNRYKKKLNNKTPVWFKDWYAQEFVPYKVRQDLLIVLATGIFIAIIVQMVF